MLRNFLVFSFALSIPLLAQNASFQRKVVPLDFQSLRTTVEAKADFNNDGVPDLVSIQAAGSAWEMDILMSNGAGSFRSTPDKYSVPANFQLRAADVNNDGFPDVVGTDGTTLYVYLNDGSGHLQTPLTQPINGAIQDVADFNKDGKKDIVVTAFTGGNATTHTIYFGNGNGTFGPASVTLTNDARNVRSGDFDGDGNLDLVMAASYDAGEEGSSLNLYFSYGDGAGHFTTPAHFAQTFFDGGVSAVADLNKDGRADLVVVYTKHPGYPKPDDPSTAILYGAANRTFTVKDFSRVNFDYYSLFPAGDFDREGDLDLALGDYKIQYRNSDGTYSAPVSFYSGPGGSAPVVGDFNKDGHDDIVVLTDDGTGYAGQVEIFQNTVGGPTCTAPTTAPDMVICEPAIGSTVDSPLHLRATAKLHSAVYRFEVWSNNVKIFTARDTASIDTMLDLSPGSYNLALVARTASGERLERTVTFNVQASSDNCTKPSSPGVVICQPAPYANVTSPFHVRAFANTGGTTYRFELWNRSTKLFTARSTDLMDTNISLAPGTYFLHFVARRADGVHFESSEYVFVK
jgi:hypothetical protein